MTCKVLMMMRTGGYILSSNLLVVLSIDRYISISNPLSSLNAAKQRRRAKCMVLIAYLATILFASPQAVIFRVLKHPVKEFWQCTTYNFFESVSTPVQFGNHTELRFLRLSPVQCANLYHTIFNCEVFFGPVIAISTSYAKIYTVLKGRSKSILSGFEESRNLEERLSQRKKRRSIMKALKMSVIHVIFFILSWTPYTAMATWDTIDKASAKEVPAPVQDILYLTAALNSCINPFIYGVYYYKENTAPCVRVETKQKNLYSMTQSNGSIVSKIGNKGYSTKRNVVPHEYRRNISGIPLAMMAHSNGSPIYNTTENSLSVRKVSCLATANGTIPVNIAEV